MVSLLSAARKSWGWTKLEVCEPLVADVFFLTFFLLFSPCFLIPNADFMKNVFLGC